MKALWANRQDEQIQTIEATANNVETTMEAGHKEIEKGVKSAKKARRKRWSVLNPQVEWQSPRLTDKLVYLDTGSAFGCLLSLSLVSLELQTFQKLSHLLTRCSIQPSYSPSPCQFSAIKASSRRAHRLVIPFLRFNKSFLDSHHVRYINLELRALIRLNIVWLALT